MIKKKMVSPKSKPKVVPIIKELSYVFPPLGTIARHIAARNGSSTNGLKKEPANKTNSDNEGSPASKSHEKNKTAGPWMFQWKSSAEINSIVEQSMMNTSKPVASPSKSENTKSPTSPMSLHLRSDSASIDAPSEKTTSEKTTSEKATQSTESKHQDGKHAPLTVQHEIKKALYWNNAIASRTPNGGSDEDEDGELIPTNPGPTNPFVSHEVLDDVNRKIKKKTGKELKEFYTPTSPSSVVRESAPSHSLHTDDKEGGEQKKKFLDNDVAAKSGSKGEADKKEDSEKTLKIIKNIANLPDASASPSPSDQTSKKHTGTENKGDPSNLLPAQLNPRPLIRITPLAGNPRPTSPNLSKFVALEGTLPSSMQSHVRSFKEDEDDDSLEDEQDLEEEKEAEKREKPPSYPRNSVDEKHYEAVHKKLTPKPPQVAQKPHVVVPPKKQMAARLPLDHPTPRRVALPAKNFNALHVPHTPPRLPPPLQRSMLHPPKLPLRPLRPPATKIVRPKWHKPPHHARPPLRVVSDKLLRAMFQKLRGAHLQRRFNNGIKYDRFGHPYMGSVDVAAKRAVKRS